MVDELAVLIAGHGEELLEDVAVEQTAGVLLGAVRHEVDDEVVRGGRDEASEWGLEEVWVVHLGESCDPVGLLGGHVEVIGLPHVVEVFP